MRVLLILAVLLSGCGGYEGEEEDWSTPGVEVTADVPHAYTSGMNGGDPSAPEEIRAIPIMRR